MIPLWIGYLDETGSPALKLSIGGPLPGSSKEFEVIIDTGFSGFISMTIVKAFPLGLLLLGTTGVVLADGSHKFKLTAMGIVTIEQESQAGVIILEPSSEDILIGMDFLRTFNRGLLVYPNKSVVVLVGEDMVEALIKAQSPDPPATS